MRAFTNSELATWRECKRQWWLKYHRRLDPKTAHLNVNREVGSCVHDVLAWGYENTWEETDVESSVAYVVYALQENVHDEECGICQEAIKEIHNLTKLMIEGYVEWLSEEGADQDYELLEAETPIEFFMNDLGVMLLGKIDARFKRISDGATVFFDHKTVQNLTDIPKTAHLDTQFKHYHLLQRAATEERTDGLVINMLRRVKRTARAKPPFYGRHEVRHNDDELRQYWYQVRTQIIEILGVEKVLDSDGMSPDFDVKAFMFPSPTRDCSWKCDFFAVCPMFDRGEDAEDFLQQSYIEVDPLARYAEDAGFMPQLAALEGPSDG